MKIKQQYKKGFILNTLALSMLVIHLPAYALQALDDSDLRNVNGQDGIHIETTLKEANIKTLYWTDQVGRADDSPTSESLTATADAVKLQKSNISATPLTADLKLNMGTASAKAGIGLDLSLSPILMTVDSFRICDSDPSGLRCSAKIGNLAVQTTSNTTVALKTANGIFSKTDQADLTLGIQNANIYLGQVSADNQLNQLILKNFNFNFKGKGFIFVDPVEGLKLQTNAFDNSTGLMRKANNAQVPDASYGYVDLNRVVDSASSNSGFVNTGTYSNTAKTNTTNSGLNLEFMLNQNVSQTSPYTLDVTNTPTGAKGLIRVGASGRMVNGSLQFRGVQNAGSLIGFTDTGKDIVGGSGLAFRLKTDFTKDNDTMLAGGGEATTLEIGGAGINSYGFEFGNLTGLQKDTRASFDTGSIFINLTDSKQLTLPVNDTFQTSRFGNGQFLTSLADYKQDIYTTLPSNLNNNRPYSLVTAIRGAEFQAISRRGRFTTSAGVTPANLFTDNGLNNQWGLALPFYNLDANLALYGTNADAATSYYYTLAGTKTPIAGSGTTPRLGFSLGMSTQGRDATGTKTTSIMVIDGGKLPNGQSTDYYIGLRNVDMLLKGNGSVGVENGSFNLSLKNMLVVMAAEVAAGYLPGTTYKSCALGISTASAACSAKSSADTNNFAKSDDVLFGMKLRFGGDMDLSLIPNSEIKADGTGNRLSVLGDLKLKGTNNTIQFSDPVNGSILGLDNLMGDIGFNNAIVISKNSTTGAGQVGFNASLRFNPTQSTDGVFRARDLNFYPPVTGASTGARLGEIALTGGRLTSELNIIPRN
ncbi:MAG: heme utilization protein [Acinetobacter sp.]